MVTSVIGKLFLDAYNEKYEKNYSPKEFFDEVLFEIMYNHPKFMLVVHGSRFFQLDAVQKKSAIPEERNKAREDLHSIINSGERAGHVFVGYAASSIKEYNTTSGQITDMAIEVPEDEVYCSWIGAGLGVGVAGGFSFLFNHPDILLDIFEGWQVYRNYLNDPALEHLRPNQLNTWNGQWLNYYYSKYYSEDFDFTQLEDNGVFSVKKNVAEVNTVSWPRLFLNLSGTYPNEELSTYIYNLGQTNTTLGFYSFHLKQGGRIIDVYKQLFGENAYQGDSGKMEELFGLHIRQACQMGAIGLRAMQPNDLTAYMRDAGKMPKFKTQKDEEKDYTKNIIPFRTFKTWLTAMITKNKEENLNYSEEVAKALHAYRQGASKRDRVNLIEKELLTAKTKKNFLDGLGTLIEDVDKEQVEVFKALRDRVHLMPNEDFQYFAVLLKFDYKYQERNL